MSNSCTASGRSRVKPAFCTASWNLAGDAVAMQHLSTKSFWLKLQFIKTTGRTVTATSVIYTWLRLNQESFGSDIDRPANSFHWNPIARNSQSWYIAIGHSHTVLGGLWISILQKLNVVTKFSIEFSFHLSSIWHLLSQRWFVYWGKRCISAFP